MELVTVFKYVTLIAAVGLVVTVVLQNRSGGLGPVFGGGGGEAYRSKRGLEAILYNATILLAVVFAVSALLVAVLSV